MCTTFYADPSAFVAHLQHTDSTLPDKLCWQMLQEQQSRLRVSAAAHVA